MGGLGLRGRRSVIRNFRGRGGGFLYRFFLCIQSGIDGHCQSNTSTKNCSKCLREVICTVVFNPLFCEVIGNCDEDRAVNIAQRLC